MKLRVPFYTIIVLAAATLSAGAAFVYTPKPTVHEETTNETPLPEAVLSAVEKPVVDIPSIINVEDFGQPIADALDRVTKKPFGILIHPGQSPVPNDRFDGYHVGVDFETTADEQEIEVPIFAICDGRLRYKTYAKGYGGVAVQQCRLEGRDVSIIYGHLHLASIEPEAGAELSRGQRIGLLGQGFSQETDGVRKHLHLGIRQDLTTDIRGYVKNATETAQFVDVLRHLLVQ